MSDMRQQAPTSGTGTARVPSQRGGTTPPGSTGWGGMVVFGGMMMILLGTFQAIAGLVALFDDGYYLVAKSGLVVNVDYTAWGWVHLGIGAVALAAGAGLLSGAPMWSRVLGVAIAGLSMIVNFAFMPAFPFWALTMIALDALVIYAIAAHGREARIDG